MWWYRIRVAAGLLTFAAALGGCAGNDLPVDASPDDVLTHAQRELADDDYYQAVEELEYFVRSFPGNSRMPLAKLRLGDARFGLEEYLMARGHYEGVVEDYPGSELVEEARYKIALCSYSSTYPHDRDQSETEQALRLFQDFVADYPESRFLPEVEEAVADCRDRLAHREFEAGQFYEKQDRGRSAKIQYEYVVNQYPETEWAPQACFRLGELYRDRERWEEARRWYGRLIRDWPESQESGEARQLLDTIDVARAEKGEGDS
ncbi:MAG TPA: outer membrane protein assembly factor BamD [bacterium]|nr:outer membrane protein assembly factor BamD [bacterium]